jgi:hypothetical protein
MSRSICPTASPTLLHQAAEGVWASLFRILAIIIPVLAHLAPTPITFLSVPANLLGWISNLSSAEASLTLHSVEKQSLHDPMAYRKRQLFVQQKKNLEPVQ